MRFVRLSMMLVSEAERRSRDKIDVKVVGRVSRDRTVAIDKSDRHRLEATEEVREAEVGSGLGAVPLRAFTVPEVPPQAA
jgi:hypothetical protein